MPLLKNFNCFPQFTGRRPDATAGALAGWPPPGSVAQVLPCPTPCSLHPRILATSTRSPFSGCCAPLSAVDSAWRAHSYSRAPKSAQTVPHLGCFPNGCSSNRGSVLPVTELWPQAPRLCPECELLAGLGEPRPLCRGLFCTGTSLGLCEKGTFRLFFSDQPSNLTLVFVCPGTLAIG